MTEHGAFPLSFRSGSAAFGCMDMRTSALIVADGPEALRLSRLAKQGGARLLGVVPPQSAAGRLDRMVDMGLAIVHCPRPSAGLDDLLARLDMLSDIRETRLLAITTLASVDHVHGAVTSDAAHLLCDPSDAELADAIAWAARPREPLPLLQDSNAHPADEPEPIRMLREEIRRLTHLLEGFLDTHAASAIMPQAEQAKHPQTVALTSAHLRELLRVRRMRDQFLPSDLFADPAWDMLLDLMAARLGGERVSVSSLCIAAAVPPTTALRWIRLLTDRGILIREADPADGRRIFIGLSDDAAEAILRWYGAVQPSLGAVRNRRSD